MRLLPIKAYESGFDSLHQIVAFLSLFCFIMKVPGI